MFIELTSCDTDREVIINLEHVKEIRPFYHINGKIITVFKYFDKSETQVEELYEDVKKKIKQEAKKQTSVINRFELMELD